MLKGFGRTPFGPRPTPGLGAGDRRGPAAGRRAPRPRRARPRRRPADPAPPAAARPREAVKEPNPADEAYETLKRHIHMRLVDRLDLNRVTEMDPNTLRSEIRGVVEHLCDTENPLLNRNERQRLVNEILDETFGFGPLELLLKDEKIADIMINGPRRSSSRRRGGSSARRWSSATTSTCSRSSTGSSRGSAGGSTRPRRWSTPGSPTGRGSTPSSPRCRSTAPRSRSGCSARRPLTKDDLLRFKAFTPEMLALMEGAMKARLNIIISGGTGSGKTTLLNTLSSFIQPDHRVITIEDAAELQLQQDHVVRLETRPPNIEGRGAVTATDLVKNALRMRPDRIIIGECRGAETLDMIQAMNTGHEGSMTTVHANTPRDALSRLETMISMAGLELPIRALRSQFASAVDLIIQASRLQGGPRKVVSISEVVGMEGDTIIMQEIFAFRQLGVDAQRPRPRRVHRHRHPAHLHGPPGIRGLSPAARHVPRTGSCSRIERPRRHANRNPTFIGAIGTRGMAGY